MEDGQGIEHHIAVIEIDMGAHLGDIGEKVFVTERHAFGLAFGARGEQDRRGFLVRGPVRQKIGSETAGQSGELIGEREFRPHIFQIDELRRLADGRGYVFQLAQLDEAMGGNHPADFRGA